ncbi:MAG TPA: hypothetical protein VN441_00770 [Syntrophomonas sp.]|nr:hypothetical protein [Syntrophomonas sp.]
MPNYKHLYNMTDETGILQFSQTHHPDRNSGYTLDDNARALLVALSMGDEGYPLAMIYTRFLRSCWQDNGSWCNLLQDGRFISKFDSEDSFGRAFWACSQGSNSEWPSVAEGCTKMLEMAAAKLPSLYSARGIAYGLLSLCKGSFTFFTDRQRRELIQLLSERLLALYQNHHSHDWHWFEDKVTYCNGVMPQSLLASHTYTGSKVCLKIGLESLRFLNDLLFAKGYLQIIGNQGWYVPGGNLPVWDQQPVDAASIIFACHEAYQVTGLREYQQLTRTAYNWYRGENINELSLYDVDSGGCFDALIQGGVNLNQGAEALLSLLLSDLLLEEYGVNNMAQAQSV